MSLLRRFLVWTFRKIIGIYFREIEATGNIPEPGTGGRVFVANHVNAIVDPILVLTTAPCPISPVAKSTLWKIPGLRFLLDTVGAVPILRRRDDPTKDVAANEAVFDRVAAWLESGGNILIFPEGTSHSEPHLIELKTGAARMLARARDRGARGLTLQAVALEFDARDIFRSRCLLVYGPVRSVDELGGGDELEIDEQRASVVAAMTEHAREDLSELLIEGATWAERLLIARVAEMLAHEMGDRTLAGWSSIGRQVEAAKRSLAELDEPTIHAIAEAVDRYYALLAREGVSDADLTRKEEVALAGVARAVFFLAMLPLAIIGVVLYAVPYQVPRLMAWKVREMPDEISTYKLGAGLVVFPLWAAGLVALSFVLLPTAAAAVGSVVALVSPFAALAWLDVSPQLHSSIRVATRTSRMAELRRARAEALALIERERVRLFAAGDDR